MGENYIKIMTVEKLEKDNKTPKHILFIYFFNCYASVVEQGGKTERKSIPSYAPPFT